MKKLVIIIILSLFFPLVVSAQMEIETDKPLKGYVKYSHEERTCDFSDSITDEFRGLKLGWQKQNGNLVYVAGCYNWYGTGCCNEVCDSYDREDGSCEIKEELLRSLDIFFKGSSDQLLSYIVYLLIILFVIIVTYFIIGIVSIVYFIVRG